MNPQTSPNSPRLAGTVPDDTGCSLLRMAVGTEAMAVPIDDVREILEVGRLTALPRTPEFVRGVMNLRGAVVPVIDLAARLGQPAITIGRRSCVVVVEAGLPADDDSGAEASDNEPEGTGSLVVGLLVDAVFEVFDTPAGAMEAVPQLGTPIDASYLRGMARTRGEVIGVLALDRVLAQQELTGLIAEHRAH
jgi:purine-binding chemotaxis protein CheW